jgi:nicotinate (nicotinamide) nucleotide adenylyltransferase
LEELSLDKLIIMPSGEPPHKTLPRGTPAAAHRLEMSRLTFEGLPGTAVSDFELAGGASYTIDTVNMLIAEYQPKKLWLLMGSDMRDSFDSWHGAEELRRLVEPFVISRDVCPVSSTELRENLDGDKMPAAVLSYIRKKGLYGASDP